MSKKNKIIILPLLVVLVSSVGIYTTSFFNKVKIENKAEANTMSSDELAKQSIQDKILNSIDYFKNAKGSFRYYIKKSDIDETISFKVKLNGKPASYVETINNQDQTSVETTFDGDNRLNVSHKDKMYNIDPVLKANLNDPSPPKTAQQRYIKNSDGTSGFILSRDPADMGIASSILNNQYVALGFLEDHKKWKICKDDVFLGLPAIVITGELPDIYKTRFDATSFKVLVHKDTGIILNLEIYNNSGEIVNKIKLNDIKLNSLTTSDNEKLKIKIPQNYQEIKQANQK